MAQINTTDGNAGQDSYKYAPVTGPLASNVPLNEISTRAFRYLMKNYPNAAQQKWFRTPNGFSVIFESDSILTKIYYNQRGDFTFSMKYYMGEALEAALKTRLQRSFPGYKIGIVSERYDGSLVSYGINISKDHKMKTFEIDNNEIKNLKEFDDESESK
jgi:hypothetical protein